MRSSCAPLIVYCRSSSASTSSSACSAHQNCNSDDQIHGACVWAATGGSQGRAFDDRPDSKHRTGTETSPRLLINALNLQARVFYAFNSTPWNRVLDESPVFPNCNCRIGLTSQTSLLPHPFGTTFSMALSVRLKF
jgi:hypothetical protein